MPISRTVLPAPKLPSLIGVRAVENAITLVARTSSRVARCPVCGKQSGRVHSQYTRGLSSKVRRSMTTIGTIKFTRGSISSSYLGLAHVMDLFPKDAIGGAAAGDKPSARRLEIHGGVREPVRTDISGPKLIFRRRKWVREV